MAVVVFPAQNRIDAKTIPGILIVIYLAEQKLLFFKPKKTAGTSVEIALSCNAVAEDIVTPVMPLDERKRYEVGGRFPQNWAWKPQSEEEFKRRFEVYLETGLIKRRWFGLKGGRLYPRHAAKFVNHIRPNLVIRRAGQKFVDDAFVVTMSRHPYETMVSWASHLRADSGKDFDRLLEKVSRHAPLNEVYLFGPRKPDFVIRYEHLQHDLAVLEEKFGLSLLRNLPVTKGQARTDRRNASEILSTAQKEWIRKSHHRTFEAYGYAP